MDILGDKIKKLERDFAGDRLSSDIPMVARLDGKAFHTFCRGLKRPYDERMSSAMVSITKKLMELSGADIGYTQSDEITLVWKNDVEGAQAFFGGKKLKIVGELSSIASLWFNHCIESAIPEKSFSSTGKHQRFDCRVFSMEDYREALQWRELDAVKNSISMAADAYYSPKELHGKGQRGRLKMLEEAGIDWNAYPTFFKSGTYVVKTHRMIKYSADELSHLPEKHEARSNPDLMVRRGVIEESEMSMI